MPLPRYKFQAAFLDTALEKSAAFKESVAEKLSSAELQALQALTALQQQQQTRAALQPLLAERAQAVAGPGTNARGPGGVLGRDPVLEADPSVAQNVLTRARLVRDPSDYLRLLSADPDVNSIARTAALPTMLMADAMLGRSLRDAQTRESIIDALQNLQGTAHTEARPVSAMPTLTRPELRAYPMLYPR